MWSFQICLPIRDKRKNKNKIRKYNKTDQLPNQSFFIVKIRNFQEK